MRLRANQSINRTSATKSQADKIIERNFLLKQGVFFLVRRYILGAKQLLQITCSVRPIWDCIDPRRTCLIDLFLSFGMFWFVLIVFRTLLCISRWLDVSSWKQNENPPGEITTRVPTSGWLDIQGRVLKVGGGGSRPWANDYEASW